LWRLRIPADRLREIGASIGADVPFFFEGGTVLGLDRGDLLFPLIDHPPAWVVVARPAFGVSTRDAYAWWDTNGAAAAGGANDLEPVVAARHPEIARLTARMRRAAAAEAAMSGSGSAVFGLFDSEAAAQAAARAVAGRDTATLVTRTLNRAQYRRRAAPFVVPSKSRVD
jgi:4-diphosphocytidyl-2-C-methyl-D-erythritol kinase